MTSLLGSVCGPLLAAGGGNMSVLLTMVVAVAAGVILIAVSRRIGVSAIVLLLLGGIVLGPQVGIGLVQPAELGDGLTAFVALAVGLILFEGGLSLDLAGYRKASMVIIKLLTIGVLVTWFATAGLIWLLFDFPFSFCLLAASIVIVTGPTVINPLLKRIRVQPKLHSILHWEGVLIDPIGVFIAILCFEWFAGSEGGQVATNFGMRVAVGAGLGLACGWLLWFLLKRRLIPDDMIDTLPPAVVVAFFGLAEYFASESGLLTTTVAGFLLAASGLPEVKLLRHFKESLADILIGTLFILLAARLSFEQFAGYGLPLVAVVAGVMFIVRPLNIFGSTLGEKLSWREKGFLSWVAPRGIVAASMSSLFALQLADRDDVDAAFLEVFTYSIIIATVLLQGFTAGIVAKKLHLQRPQPDGWLIIGAHAFGRRLAAFLKRRAKKNVFIIDTNARAVAEANKEGLRAIQTDARDLGIIDSMPDLQTVGNVLALTDNEDLNRVLASKWGESVGRQNVYFWPGSSARATTEELQGSPVWPTVPKPALLSGELQRGEARLSEVSIDANDFPGVPLATLIGTRVTIETGEPRTRDAKARVEKKPTTKGKDERVTLYIDRSANYLRRAMRPELLVDADADNLESLFSQLIERVVTVEPRLPREEIVKDLLDREQVFPSSVGHRVAIPHAYSAALTIRICLLARLGRGISFRENDEPVRLVFLLISPSGDPEGHLATLAEIARVVRLRETVDRLLDVQPIDQVLDVIREQEG